MKRTLIYLLIATAVAGFLGTLIARDPGYVLIAYDGHSLQMGLWVLLALLVILIVVVYYGTRLIRGLIRSSSYFKAWRDETRRSRAGDLTVKGLNFFEEGEFDRAERFLTSGAQDTTASAINYIYAAKAADRQGKREQRESYLRQALELDSGTKNAVAVASAEMALERGEFQRALDHIADVKANDQVTRLKGEALIGLGDWQALSEILPQLRKIYSEGDFHQLQKQVVVEQLTSTNISDEARAAIYKKLPSELADDIEIVQLYCAWIEGEKDAELAIRNALKRSWQPELLTQYALLGAETLARRIKAAEGWLKQHDGDAELHLCLGELYEANGEKEKAKSAYQKSIDLANHPLANANLGRLLAFDGDYKKGTEHLTRALN